MFAIHTKAETNNNWCSLVVAPSRLIGETHLFVFCHSPELSVVRLISSSRKSAVILFKAFDYHSTVVSAIRNPRFTVRRLQFYQNFFIIIFAANFVTTTTRNRIYSQCSRIVRSLQWRRNEFESGGHRSRAKVGRGSLIRYKAPEKNFGRAPPLFGSKSTISRFRERFRDGQYSLVSFLLAVLLLTVLPCPAICKSGRARAPVPHGVGTTGPYTKCAKVLGHPVFLVNLLQLVFSILKPFSDACVATRVYT